MLDFLLMLCYCCYIFCKTFIEGAFTSKLSSFFVTEQFNVQLAFESWWIHMKSSWLCCCVELL